MELRHNLSTVFFSLLIGVTIAVYRNQRLMRNGQIKTLRVSPLVLGILLTLPFGAIIYYTSAIWWLLRAELLAIAVVVGASIVHTPRGRVVSFFGGRFDVLHSTDHSYSRAPFEARWIVMSDAPDPTLDISVTRKLSKDESFKVAISGTIKDRNGADKRFDDKALARFGKTLIEALEYATVTMGIDKDLPELRDMLCEQMSEVIHNDPDYLVENARLEIAYIDSEDGEL